MSGRTTLQLSENFLPLFPLFSSLKPSSPHVLCSCSSNSHFLSHRLTWTLFQSFFPLFNFCLFCPLLKSPFHPMCFCFWPPSLGLIFSATENISQCPPSINVSVSFSISFFLSLSFRSLSLSLCSCVLLFNSYQTCSSH